MFKALFGRKDFGERLRDAALCGRIEEVNSLLRKGEENTHTTIPTLHSSISVCVCLWFVQAVTSMQRPSMARLPCTGLPAMAIWRWCRPSVQHVSVSLCRCVFGVFGVFGGSSLWVSGCGFCRR